jgi:TolB-like protein
VRWLLPAAGLAVGIIALFALNRAPPERDRSLAVLPFKSLGGGAENAYFADGIHEDLLTQLAKFPELKVISRTSVMQYRDPRVSMREIGRTLGVAVVLEGSVRRAGNQVRVVAQLIDAQTDQHLWADTYDRELTDVFAIQSEIAQNIARVLHADLSPQRKASAAAVPTTVTEAYDTYLRARNLMYATPVQQFDYPQAQQLLERAIQLDPEFAFAYGELARLHAGAIWTGMDASDARAAAAAKAIEHAVRLRPDAAETHIAAGYYHYWARRDYPRALHELEQARAQLPGSAEVLHVIGLIQRRVGEVGYAIESFSSAAQRDPARSLSFTYLAESLAALGRFPEANRAYQNALARLPSDAYTLRTYGDMHVAWRGRTDTLRAAVARMPATRGALGGVPAARFRIAMLERDCTAAAAAVEGTPELFGLQHAVRPRALYSAWAAECNRQHDRARAFYREAERVTRQALAQEGAHPVLHLVLGHTLVGQDKPNEGIAAGRRALELISYDKDAVFGGYQAIEMAALYTRAHEFEQALELLEQYCGRPFGIWPNELRLEPRWDALRALPRFQTLVGSAC